MPQLLNATFEKEKGGVGERKGESERATAIATIKMFIARLPPPREKKFLLRSTLVLSSTSDRSFTSLAAALKRVRRTNINREADGHAKRFNRPYTRARTSIVRRSRVERTSEKEEQRERERAGKRGGRGERETDR